MLRHDRRTVRHTPKVVMGRDGAQLIHGEPRCNARIAPGSTTTIDCDVDCDLCISILEEKSK